MKKTLLLSVVASTMIMAGGDIAPVEPVVAPVAVSAWDFSGQAVVYYQTNDGLALSGLTGGDLFEQDASGASVGIQLKAVNKDVFAGIGAGFTVNGLSTLNLENGVVSNVAQGTGNAAALGNGNDIDDVTDGGWIGEAYLTYGTGNTSLKAGRQTLPQSLSPFAYSENWNVFENTFDAALIVNTDIANTVLVGAWVAGANYNAWGALNSNLTDFNSLNDDRGLYLFTAQNKSITDLTLTGSFYYGAEYLTLDDLTILWGDAAYDAGTFNVAIQGGSVMHDAINDTEAFGGKIGATVSGATLGLAYSNVNDSTFGMFNLGGTTSALYTNTVANQLVSNVYEIDADKFVGSASIAALGGNISGVYAYTDSAITDTTTEFDFIYGTNVAGIDLTAAYAYIDADLNSDAINVVRVVGSYKF